MESVSYEQANWQRPVKFPDSPGATVPALQLVGVGEPGEPPPVVLVGGLVPSEGVGWQVVTCSPAVN